MKTPGEILKKFRERKEITGTELGEILGCTQQQVSRWEKGLRKMSNEKLNILKEIMLAEEYKELEDAIKSEKIKEITGEIEIIDKTTIPIYKIPYFSDLQASAGYGRINDNSEQEYIEVPATLKSPYNIAVKISGDSMEPEFKDGDIVIINTCLTEIKQDKFFVVNYDDFVYLKQIIKKSGKYYLHSVNPYYPDLEIKDCDRLKVIGQVITVSRNY